MNSTRSQTEDERAMLSYDSADKSGNEAKAKQRFIKNRYS